MTTPDLPIPPSTLSTPRLTLVRLTDTSPGSQHVQWFHENWSDPVATAWRYRPHIPHPSSYALTTHSLPMLLALKHSSLCGATKSLAESRLRMLEQTADWDTWFYAVFTRDDAQHDGLGTHVGSVSLRRVGAGPELLPPRTFEGAGDVGAGGVLSDEEVKGREADWEGRKLDLRVLGYAFFAHAQGMGYATEACRGLLEGYAGRVREWESSEGAGERVFYVEAGVDLENPGSQRVLRKLGFRTVGLKVEKEKAWLNGGWRGPGWWITGLYI